MKAIPLVTQKINTNSAIPPTKNKIKAAPVSVVVRKSHTYRYPSNSGTVKILPPPTR
jgi:hypothetical protein